MEYKEYVEDNEEKEWSLNLTREGRKDFVKVWNVWEKLDTVEISHKEEWSLCIPGPGVGYGMQGNGHY